MKFLARNEKNSIVHIDLAGEGNKKYYHALDRTPMAPSRNPFSRKCFVFDINSQRAGREGLGIGLVSTIHELTLIAFLTQKTWKFHFKGDIYTVQVQRVLDDMQIRCGPKTIFADLVLMLDPDSAHYSQFRGKLVVFINTHDVKHQKLNEKRIEILQGAGHFVLTLDMPIYLCSKKKVPPTPAYLNGISQSLSDFLGSTPTVQMPVKPGWCKGEPISSFQSQSENTVHELGGLDFSISTPKRPKSKQPKLISKLATLLGASS